MTLASPTAVPRSKLDALIPHRPRRPRSALPTLAAGSVPDLAAARFAGRRGLLGALSGGVKWRAMEKICTTSSGVKSVS